MFKREAAWGKRGATVPTCSFVAVWSQISEIPTDADGFADTLDAEGFGDGGFQEESDGFAARGRGKSAPDESRRVQAAIPGPSSANRKQVCPWNAFVCSLVWM